MFRWKVLEAHARDVSLTQQAIHSFDDFVARSVPEIVNHYNRIEVTSQLVENGPKRIVTFSNPTYKQPSIVEKNQDVRPLTPEEARHRDLTFSAPMYIDLEYQDGNTKTVLKQIYIGRMPIMVRSALGKINDPLSECEHDPGGYMIINGNEKVVIVQQRVIPNVVMCFSHQNMYQAVVHSCSNKWTGAYCALKITGDSLIPPKVEISGMNNFVPVFVFLIALGWKVEELQTRLGLNNEEWDLWLKETNCTKEEDCMNIILSKLKNKNNPKRAFLYLFYPHVNTMEERKELAMYQTLSLIQTFRKERKCDSRDQLLNKRLDTAGALMTSLFAIIWNKYIEEIQTLMQKCCDKNKQSNTKG